jgi:hypothetical protein
LSSSGTKAVGSGVASAKDDDIFAGGDYLICDGQTGNRFV